MAYFHFMSIKAKNLSRFETMWFLTSIVLLISSIMCLAVALMALILPGVNMIMNWLVVASLSFGLVSFLSMRSLKKRQNSQQCYL